MKVTTTDSEANEMQLCVSDRGYAHMPSRVCFEHDWTLSVSGIVDNVEYVPGSGRQLLARNASLELCDEMACRPTKVTVTVKLEATDISSNKCEVDADSIASRNQFCGALVWLYRVCLRFCFVNVHTSYTS